MTRDPRDIVAKLRAKANDPAVTNAERRALRAKASEIENKIPARILLNPTPKKGTTTSQKTEKLYDDFMSDLIGEGFEFDSDDWQEW